MASIAAIRSGALTTAEMALLQVRTGCRLHFGLMELAEDEPHRFGGLGLMLDAPQLLLEFCSQEDSQSWPTVRSQAIARPSELHRRIEAVIQTRRELSGCILQTAVRVVQPLELHTGLGAGTQLASTVAVGLELMERLKQFPLPSPGWSQWHDARRTLPDLSPKWLVEYANRGSRSAIGVHGFLDGGLVLDLGYPQICSPKLPGRPVLTSSLNLPSAWRVVLISPLSCSSVCGEQEQAWIAELSRKANPHRRRMLELAQKAVESAKTPGDFTAFTEQLDEYMQLTSRLFSAHQGGSYNGNAVSMAVATAREMGLRAVGQSSWGPTVFGFAPNLTQAERTAALLRGCGQLWDVTVACPAATGAQWRWREPVE